MLVLTPEQLARARARARARLTTMAGGPFTDPRHPLGPQAAPQSQRWRLTDRAAAALAAARPEPEAELTPEDIIQAAHILVAEGVAATFGEAVVMLTEGPG